MASALDILEQAQSQLTGQLGKNYEDTKAATDKIVQLTNTKSEVESRLKAQEIQDSNSAIDIGKQIATSLGANPQATNYRLKDLAAIQSQSSDEALAATKQYQELSATSFFDNPVTWFFNQFEKDSVAEQANAATKRARDASQEATNINNQIQSGAVTAKIISQTTNSALMADQIKLAGIASEEAAAKMQVEAIKTNADALKSVMQGNNVLMSAEQHKQSIVMQQQHLALQQRSMARHEFESDRDYELRVAQFEEARTQHSISNDFRQQAQELATARFDNQQVKEGNAQIIKLEKAAADALKAGKKDEHKAIMSQLSETKKQLDIDMAISKRDAMADLAKRYADAADYLGVSDRIYIPRDNPIEAEKIITKGLADKGMAGKVFSLISQNVDSAMKQNYATGDGKPVMHLGWTAIDAVNMKSIINPKGWRPEQYEFADSLSRDIGKLAQDYKGSAKDKELTINQQISLVYSDRAKDPEAHDHFRLPKLPELQEFKALAASPIFQKYFMPEIVNNKADSKFENIAEILNKAASDKSFNFNQVAEFGSKLYRHAIDYNNAKWGYTTMGVPAMQNYLLKGYGDRALDLSDPTDFKAALIYYKTTGGLFGVVDALPGGKFVTDAFRKPSLDSVNFRQ